MLLTHLSLTNFRNFSRLDLDVPEGVTLLVGANAQGKTSLLEAVYYLAAFVSFHASSDRQLVNLIAAKEPLAVARLVGDFLRHDASGKMGSHRIEVRIIQENYGLNGGRRLRKEVLLDGVQLKISDSGTESMSSASPKLRMTMRPPARRKSASKGGGVDYEA